VTRIWPSVRAAVAHARHHAVYPLRWDPTDHLLSRFAFGPTPAARKDLDAHGPDHWFDEQVSLGRKHLGYSAHPKVAAQAPLLKLSPFDLEQWLIKNGHQYGWDAMDQLTRVTLGLQAFSPAQLYETLVDFFANHLNVPNHNGDLWLTRHLMDRDVVRRHALGSFRDMLLASAKNPAMLLYLNLAESNKALVNENYGRELLELHTVGLHYTESDVKNCARMLTGRTLDGNYHYVYDDYIHDTHPVKVLGFRTKNASATGGQKAGDELLSYLARHHYTAQHIAQKMCVRFVSDTPSAALVDAVAKAYREHDTAILPMVSTILRSTEFWESRGRKVRRPAENLVATVRVLGVGVKDWSDALDTLHWVSAGMGNVPLDWQAPNGYPDTAEAWRSAGNLLAEWNAHLALAGGWWGGLAAADVDALYGGTPATSGAAITALARRLTGSPLAARHQDALQTFLGEPAGTALDDSTMRWLAQPLVALMLDGPHHALR
jgi:hypothetical protein